MASWSVAVLVGVCLGIGGVVPHDLEAQRALGAGKRAIDYANPLVGTAPLDDPAFIGNAPPPGQKLYAGFTSPGAVLPHGRTNVAPINRDEDLSYSSSVESPYYYPNRTMIGFSSGSPDGPVIMPVVGDWTVPPERNRSVYDKKTEKAKPGYYSVVLDDFHTRVELTATEGTGLFRVTFPKSEKAHLLLDLGRVGGGVHVVDDHTVRGEAQVRTRGQRGADPEDSFFVAEFSRPFAAFGVLRQIPVESGEMGQPIIGGNEVKPARRNIQGNYAGAYLRFVTGEGEQVLVKISTGRSYQAAEKKLRAEEPGWDFDGVKAAAEAAWESKLNRIEINGGTEKERMLFYSCLFLSFSSPHLVARKGEEFQDRDGELRIAEHDRYDSVPFWDTGRNQVVLLTLLEPEVKLDILRSQLEMAGESGYFDTSFHGDHAALMYLGDMQRGINFDWESAYAYLRKNAMDEKGPRRYLGEYLKQGWISDYVPEGDATSRMYSDGKTGVVSTLEYSWDDAALALMAKKLGKEEDYQIFHRRAYNYKNLFDGSIDFMRGRSADGKWIEPFDPREPHYNFMTKEASMWSTMWLVPQDVEGLVQLLGGRDKFAAKLDEFFSTPYDNEVICEDCTGVIGQYVHGNQPDQQVAYYYDWAGQPWKTQEMTRRILKTMYGSDASGYSFAGMDDQGSISSWYVLSAMGFYTVDPSSPNYILGSPLFRRVAIHMGNGKTFEVVAENNSETNLYIQSATLNGKPWNKPWFSHPEIANGGRLVLQMGPRPNREWGSAPDAAPPSMTQAGGK
jgi:predicted alpha-1,2-mannosidase